MRPAESDDKDRGSRHWPRACRRNVARERGPSSILRVPRGEASETQPRTWRPSVSPLPGPLARLAVPVAVWSMGRSLCAEPRSQSHLNGWRRIPCAYISYHRSHNSAPRYRYRCRLSWLGRGGEVACSAAGPVGKWRTLDLEDVTSVVPSALVPAQLWTPALSEAVLSLHVCSALSGKVGLQRQVLKGMNNMLD